VQGVGVPLHIIRSGSQVHPSTAAHSSACIASKHVAGIAVVHPIPLPTVNVQPGNRAQVEALVGSEQVNPSPLDWHPPPLT
jgi:hypothetical protein